MPLLIHFGVRNSEFDTFKSQLARAMPYPLDVMPPQLNLMVQEDEWLDTGDESILHITLKTNIPLVMTNLLVNGFMNFLVPKPNDTYSSNPPATLLVTDANDWEEEYVEFRYPE